MAYSVFPSLVSKVIIGRFGHTHGIKGWLKVNSFTSPLSNILQYTPWQVEHNGQWHVIKITTQTQNQNILAKIEGCDDPESARAYTNLAIGIEHDQLPKLTDNEYYWTDLIGLRVVNQDNIELGIVDHLLETGSNDVLVIRGNRQRLLPYTDAVIKSIDTNQGLITVDWDPDF